MATYLSLLLLFACASTSSSNPNSCKGRCGEGYYRGSFCQCDYECLGLNECCTDFQNLCTSKNSCKGRCGEPFNRGNPCHCDIDCVPYSQCCPDYESMCLMEESSNEEMTNEEGAGEELMIPEDESESTPSETSEIISSYADTDIEVKVGENSTSYSENEETTQEPNSSILASSLLPSSPSLTQTADASSMLSADEDPIEYTTQQPSEEMTTSSTPQPQENASTAPTESPTSTATTEGQASTAPTEGPKSIAPTESPTSTASTEGPSSTAPTQGPTSTTPKESPTRTTSTKDPTSTAPTEDPTSTAPTKDPTSTAPTEDPTSTAPTKDPTSTAPTEDPTSTAPTKDPTSTAPTEDPISTAPTESPTSTAPTEGHTSTAPTEGHTSTAPTEGHTSSAPAEGPTSVTEMTTMAQGEDPKESSSLKDSRATSVPKTPSTPAPVKPIKKTTQPSTDKNDKSEPKESPIDPSGFDPIRPVKQTLKPSSDKNGKTDSIKDYQADDYDTNLCSGRPVSGMTTLRNGTIVVLKGHYFWTLDKYRNPDPPQLITRVWGIPSPIDTVYTRCNCQGKTYFFKGKDYWRFENGVMDPGFPKPVSQGFGQIGHITAALSIPEYRSRKESVIFFRRGGMAQKYTYQVTPTCGKKPKIPVFTVRMRTRRQAATALGQIINISKHWRGFPTMVTSAVSVPSRVKEGYKYYVFSQKKYYSIKMEREKPVVLKSAAGPRENSASSFFKCQETQKN
ncbi:proteoglycan 4b [Ctenopharyngodon idella]|uniref:proteoglycan 4b n=1 Tax=Ctenopharyngodon idella TaxID=7959 RepID=UPI002230629E|nr:proteoglycan 4b [Ctenopharyngodon idella]